MSTATLPPLTREERAVAWLRDHAGNNNFLRSVLFNFDRFGRLSEKQLEAVERNMNRPARVVNPNPVTEEGMYRQADGTVFRVKRSRQSGNLYAMRFDPEAQVRSERFVYARGVIQTLTADLRMSVEQAQALGVQFGICCVCGAELTATESVANGIGPVCAQRV
jgi:hypothetical protein